MRKRRLFWGRATILVLVFLVIFTGSTSFISAPAVSASGWAGWDTMDTIVILPQSDEFLDRAAQELQTYLGEMSSRSWAIVESDPGGPAVRLDVNPDLPEFTSRGDEAVKIVLDTDGIRITGKTPIATRHGAYILLEKLGVRWFFKHPAWEVVPSSLTDIGALSEVQEPSFFARNVVRNRIPAATAYRLADWNARNRFIGPATYSTSSGRMVSSSSYAYGTFEEIYALHPDWFTGTPDTGIWQLDPYNPEVLDAAVVYARIGLDRPPVSVDYCHGPIEIGGVSLAPRDLGGWDPPYDMATEQSATDVAFYLANEVAKIVIADYPDKLVQCLNYSYHAGIPSYDLSPNLISYVVTGQHKTTLTFQQRFEGLYAKGIKVGVYDSVDVWWGSHDLRSQPPGTKLDYIKRLAWFADMGATAYVAEGTDGWGPTGLIYYLISKVLWNHNVDVDALADDFYTKAFGPAKIPMKHWYETIVDDDAALQACFMDLDEAENLAAGDDEILERIRQLEYYTRYVWLFHNIGITNLTLEEMSDFYTFVTKISDFDLLCWFYLQGLLRDELTSRGLTSTQIDELEDFTLPTVEEARTWLDEALANFSGVYIPYINPRLLDLQALGDTIHPRQPVMHTKVHNILVPSAGNEDVEVLVKGLGGHLQWYNPQGIRIDDADFSSGPYLDWVPITFRADTPGNYIIHATYYYPSGTDLYLDVPNRPAAFIADPRRNVIFKPNENPPRNAPYFLAGSVAVYFNVPVGTPQFIFGADTFSTSWPASGQLTDPDGVIYPYNFDTVGDGELLLDSPVPGTWKIEWTKAGTWGHIWLIGIPPLVWHDAEYLLVPAADSTPSPPILNPIGDKIAYVGLPFQFTISAFDLNYDPLTFSASNLPPWASFNPVTSTLSGTANQTGIYSNVQFEVSDGSLTDSENITITAVINQAPVLDAIGNKSVTEGQNLQFTLSATDLYGDSLTYSASNLPEGASFDTRTKTFSWTPRYDQAGVYTIHFEVTDGKLTDTEDITITVIQLYEDWDVNGDGAANVLDIVLVGQHWGETGLTGWIQEDTNEDGIVNVLDIIIIGQHWTG